MSIINKRFGATDGFIKMPDETDHYIFGFVDLSDVDEKDIFEYRGKAALLAPMLDVYEYDEVYLTLTNLGFPERPDLDDTHTIHWHGFPNQIAMWDGVPEASISVPVGRDFTYYYKPKGPGTYMYHCHFEPVEHIQMGMVGPLIVRPLLDKDPAQVGRKFAYNNIATQYQREAYLMLTELDSRPHSEVLNVQEFDWTDYKPDYWLMSGRSYPDTIKPSNDVNLPNQPYSSLIQARPGEEVLLRIVNLGFQEHSIQILGIPLKIVGQDASEVKGLNGEDLGYWKDTVYIGAGQTVDAIFTASIPGVYPVFSTSQYRNTNAGNTLGGMITEVRVSIGSI